ncbi:protein-tyrosine phosphatase-like protein [Dunaliella salina]|uniref:Protein-tyrosine phosphatase-like protein n=1 Tax=Dunaliella salina TaxID=3046 RepID=A0ABQ7GZW4_DUNSA|nr:protein-tyrosine phosphatase-like protein [Dunaliella salina]|eukprot:KAF5840147.1 protein-tyrosine phosphatase-like protein [Dunaliella salina]
MLFLRHNQRAGLLCTLSRSVSRVPTTPAPRWVQQDRMIIKMPGHPKTLSGTMFCASAGGEPAASPSRETSQASTEPATQPGADQAASDAEEAAKSDEYNEIMNRRMGTSLSYRHELGLDYNRILPDLIVGSCLQTAADVDRLAEQEGVTTVFCIQEDTDMAYFNLDLRPIQERCKERGDIKHVRFPIHDFDPYDLRRKLPSAVSKLAQEHNPRTGVVYIHCTAGMGRAPATALAYMNWIRGIQLDEGFKLLTSLRRCGPKVAGLDVGWHAPIDLEMDPNLHCFILRRKMYPGTYQYKFIIDGNWTYSADHFTTQDGNCVNNLLEVIPSSMDQETMQKQIKYLTPSTKLTPEEQSTLRSMLCPWASHEDLTLPGDANALSLMDAMRAEAEKVEERKMAWLEEQEKRKKVEKMQEAVAPAQQQQAL